MDKASSYASRIESSIEHEDAELDKANCYDVEKASLEIRFEHRRYVFRRDLSLYASGQWVT